jgi:hypothetical protein
MSFELKPQAARGFSKDRVELPKSHAGWYTLCAALDAANRTYYVLVRKTNRAYDYDFRDNPSTSAFVGVLDKRKRKRPGPRWSFHEVPYANDFVFCEPLGRLYAATFVFDVRSREVVSAAAPGARLFSGDVPEREPILAVLPVPSVDARGAWVFAANYCGRLVRVYDAHGQLRFEHVLPLRPPHCSDEKMCRQCTSYKQGPCEYRLDRMTADGDRLFVVSTSWALLEYKVGVARLEFVRWGPSRGQRACSPVVLAVSPVTGNLWSTDWWCEESSEYDRKTLEQLRIVKHPSGPHEANFHSIAFQGSRGERGSRVAICFTPSDGCGGLPGPDAVLRFDEK